MPSEDQGPTEVTHASRTVILGPAKLQLQGQIDETSNEEMEQGASATAKRKRPTEDAAARSFQAVWSARDPTEEDKGPWERASTRARLKAQLKESGAPQPTSIKRERETIGTHVIRLQTTEKCDMTKLDPAELQDVICATADDQSLAAYLILKVNPTSNTLIVSTCDTKQAARLFRMQVLPLRSRAPLPIKAYQVPAPGRLRGVIYGCRANETSETLAKALV
ncbi:hypothetical protein HPB48_020672 [Haemaphysalis longicornis]|uniref:Uncharacterized protein n=1 Tax=Haemaphysalis longicornis TaxID=44386 RepID=A0A9J6FMC8_HAELO|nr:hypothetical protein HPB48_020672 [Haemaphysalis longicornis]